jgi:hypothetical protein
MKFNFPCTPRQLEMLHHSARILWCGTATKTGKSASSYVWLIDGLLSGEACAFIGPWFFRSRAAFDQIKILLEPFIRKRTVRINESRLQITASGGGYIDFQSADNPDCLFGGNYHRLVLDESSRMPEAIHSAALTTISATAGRVRFFFNLELGVKNWSIRNLLRVQRLSEAERLETGENFLTFPTDPQLVDPKLVEQLRSQMPLALWSALYEAKIPESDASLFRNLDQVFTGRESESPVYGRQYYLAADVARKKDWSVLTVVDDKGNIVATDRFHQISWMLQVERAALLYRTFRCTKAIVDATGVGDAVAEQFEQAGMSVEPFIFTVPSRRALIEELVVACDGREITVPPSEKFKVYRTEMESMEYQLDGSSIRYAVPQGLHDDALFSLALATHLYRASRGFILGLVDYLKRMAKDIAAGLRRSDGDLVDPPAPRLPPSVDPPKPVSVNNFEVWLVTNRAPACEACHATCTTYNDQRTVRCNQCGAIDGALPEPVGECCGAYLPQVVAGGVRCGSCGRQQSNHGTIVGMSRRDYGRNRFSSVVR